MPMGCLEGRVRGSSLRVHDVYMKESVRKISSGITWLHQGGMLLLESFTKLTKTDDLNKQKEPQTECVIYTFILTFQFSPPNTEAATWSTIQQMNILCEFWFE